mmetsp:Transcript_7003/g.17371  ORF Transcript_7003/g.17371 Transcript_7003/m.17371 type:complete len:251 (-) Transcript_7003:33-785(-)
MSHYPPPARISQRHLLLSRLLSHPGPWKNHPNHRAQYHLCCPPRHDQPSPFPAAKSPPDHRTHPPPPRSHRSNYSSPSNSTSRWCYNCPERFPNRPGRSTADRSAVRVWRAFWERTTTVERSRDGTARRIPRRRGTIVVRTGTARDAASVRRGGAASALPPARTDLVTFRPSSFRPQGTPCAFVWGRVRRWPTTMARARRDGIGTGRTAERAGRTFGPCGRRGVTSFRRSPRRRRGHRRPSSMACASSSF